MKLQDKYKYDSTVVGLENLYVVNDYGNFFINSPMLILPNKTVKRNNSYLLIDSSSGKRIMYPVLFHDAYFEAGIVYLFVRDMLTRSIHSLELSLECPDKKWVLIDIAYYNKLLDYRMVKLYCDNCKPSQKSSTHGKEETKAGHNT